MTKSQTAVLGALLLVFAAVSFAPIIPPGIIDYFYSCGVQVVTELPKEEPAVGAVFQGKVNDPAKLVQKLGFEGARKGDAVEIGYRGGSVYRFHVPSLKQTKEFVFQDHEFKPREK